MNKLRACDSSRVQVEDRFWSRYMKLVREKMLPYQWEALNDRVEDAAPSHCIENFKIAAGLRDGAYYGQVFQDSDAAKWLEALAYSLGTGHNRELEAAADGLIDLIGKAQYPDGYLNTYFTVKEPGERWSNLREGHELYVAGHMIEAAVAYANATGKTKFLDIACRLADCICKTFGEEEGKIQGSPGHPEIELALVKLYDKTGQRRYLEMAKYFIDARGDVSAGRFDEEQRRKGFHHIFPEFEHLGYNNIQSHMPVRRQKKADGHAVRALYLYSAMVDVACACEDQELLDACVTLFDNVTTAQMFITGSVGAAADGECFTCDYDLPNNYNYSETCASVALAMFSRRMFLAKRDGRYMDIAERALYNTVLSGMSLEGTEFFYVNPLEVIPEQLKTNRTLRHVLPHRRKWLGVACCPPNIARTLTGLGSYIYAEGEDTLYINLYVAGSCRMEVNGKTVGLTVETGYPYDGNVKICVENPEQAEFSLAFREPGWGEMKNVRIGGEKASELRREKGYVYTETRSWSTGTEIRFEIVMEPVLVYANPKVAANTGKAAILCGPLVYCLEEVDNGSNLAGIAFPEKMEMKRVFREDVLGGTVVIEAQAYRSSEEGWEGRLYRPVPAEFVPCTIQAIPYCMWNNRGDKEMRVWFRTR